MKKEGIKAQANVIEIILLILLAMAVLLVLAIFIISYINEESEIFNVKVALFSERFQVIDADITNLLAILRIKKTSEELIEIGRTITITTPKIDLISVVDLSSNNKFSESKQANSNMTDYILNFSEAQIGLVGYKNNVIENNVHSLSTNSDSLNVVINGWEAGVGKCICCGINRAVELLQFSAREKVMIIMSTSEAKTGCPEQGSVSPTADAIKAARDASQIHDILVYSIGFGEGANETTLIEIAEKGGGE